MSTTTLRLPDDLKCRIASAAMLTGMTPHSFMLEAVAEKTIKTEQQAEFSKLANDRYNQILSVGKVLNWDDVRGYLRKRVQEVAEQPPQAHKK